MKLLRAPGAKRVPEGAGGRPPAFGFLLFSTDFRFSCAYISVFNQPIASQEELGGPEGARRSQEEER